MRMPPLAQGLLSIALTTALCAGFPAIADQPSIPKLMSEGDVVGLSMAVIENGKIVGISSYGHRNNAKQPVDAHTIFNAASLSKPVFAYAVLQLADAGRLSLDEPLSTYLPDYVPGDPQAAEITARQVLSHTSGLLGGVNLHYPLKPHFKPGERFSYSSEGFLYLQNVVEKITGEDLEATAKRLVFDPLGMHDSSYVWQVRFDRDFAKPYDIALRQGIHPKYPEAKSAWTLETTAGDYARFLQAVLNGARLKPETAREWLAPQVMLKKKCVICIDAAAPDFDTHLAWGLGWGLELDQDAFFQWGDAGSVGFKAFVIGRVRDRSAIVVFTNSETGQTIIPDILTAAGFQAGPAFAWLGYARYDGSAQRFIRAMLKDGADAAWTNQDHTVFDEGTRRGIATILWERGRAADALWLRRQNAADYPDSSNCHFDLGESYLDRRQLNDALAEFGRTVELNPKRDRAAALVKLLEADTFPFPSRDGKIAFRLDGYADAKSVSVIGTFDGWESAALPMQRDGSGWQVKTNLPPGSYTYAYSIDGSLVPDVSNTRFLTDKPEAPLTLVVVGADATAR